MRLWTLRVKSVAAALVIASAIVLGRTAVAQAKPADWQKDKGYENGIPIGTKITLSNWQQFQQFMDPGLILLFQGTSFWHMPKNVVLEVGPTRHVPTPRAYIQDTEKYSGQVKLTTSPDGGYYPTGYVAGLPFPILDKAPDKSGAQIYWNVYYKMKPRLAEAPNCTYIADSHGNWTETGRRTSYIVRFVISAIHPILAASRIMEVSISARI